MRGGLYRRPTVPKGGKFGFGRAKQARWDESRRGPTEASLESFPWKPGERVDGPPRIKPVPFVSLPPDGDAS
jgi:hypothetical protein